MHLTRYLTSNSDTTCWCESRQNVQNCWQNDNYTYSLDQQKCHTWLLLRLSLSSKVRLLIYQRGHTFQKGLFWLLPKESNMTLLVVQTVLKQIACKVSNKKVPLPSTNQLKMACSPIFGFFRDTFFSWLSLASLGQVQCILSTMGHLWGVW